MSDRRHHLILSARPGSVAVSAPLSSAEAAIRAMEGPFITSAEMPSGLAWWDSYYNTLWDYLWDHPAGPYEPAGGANWHAGNSTAYYEQGAREYVEWIRFAGTQKYYDRAVACNASYRDEFLIPGGYAPSAQYLSLRGLTLDWFVNGDTRSRDTVINTANTFLPGWDLPDTDYTVNSVDTDPRIWCRIIETAWMWEKITGLEMTRYDDIVYIDDIVTRTLPKQNESGFWPLPTYCDGSYHYMEGHYLTTLIKLHDDRPRVAYNSGIATAALAFANYLWDSQWFGSPNYAFAEINEPCDIATRNTGPAPDLNGFFLPLFGWLGKHVDSLWWDRGELILLGIKNNIENSQSSVNLVDPHYKQFTETFSYTYRYFGYRYS